MQWECSAQCYVLTACHLYLTGLPDGIKTDRFDSPLTWPCFNLLVAMTAQLKCVSAGWVLSRSLCKSNTLAVQVHAPRQQ